MNRFWRFFLFLSLAFTLTFWNVSHSFADDTPPPADATADIAALERVWDVAPGSTSSYPSDMVVYNGSLYFAADANNGFGRELWQLGNPTVINIRPGSAGSSPGYLTVYDGKLYFSADGGDGAGQELWRYDPVNGAQRAADIYAGSPGSFPAHLAVFNNSLYFQANGNDGAGFELWRYDPVNGAQRAADISSGATNSNPGYLVVYDNELYFHAIGSDGAGDELWKYNPTDGAQRVVDLYPGAGGSQPWFLTVYANALYFTADGNNGAGRELWKYDPVNGAQLAADIYFGPTGSDPWWFGAYNGSLYFSRNFQLWRYDQVNGADQVSMPNCPYVQADPQYLVEYNNSLYFNLDCNDGTGRELWRYNNTAFASFRPAKSYDGWILESGETTNIGGTINATQSTFMLGDDRLNKQYRSILSFNTATLPDNIVIISATLKIRKQGGAGTNPFTTHGNIAVDIIKGAFSGNNALQASDFQSAPGRANAGVIRNQPDVNNWFTSVLAKTAYPLINPKGVTQFRLRFQKDDNNDKGADFLRFFSANSVNVGDYPVLEVKYYIP